MNTILLHDVWFVSGAIKFDITRFRDAIDSVPSEPVAWLARSFHWSGECNRTKQVFNKTS